MLINTYNDIQPKDKKIINMKILLAIFKKIYINLLGLEQITYQTLASKKTAKKLAIRLYVDFEIFK